MTQRKRNLKHESKYSFEFSIPDLPATMNAIGRAHWAVKARNARKWRELGADAIRTHRPVAPLRRARVQLTRHSSHELDFDNLAFSFKPLLDSLVQSQVIQDDDPATIGQPDYQWERAKPKCGFVVVKVEEQEE